MINATIYTFSRSLDNNQKTTETFAKVIHLIKKNSFGEVRSLSSLNLNHLKLEGNEKLIIAGNSQALAQLDYNSISKKFSWVLFLIDDSDAPDLNFLENIAAIKHVLVFDFNQQSILLNFQTILKIFAMDEDAEKLAALSAQMDGVMTDAFQELQRAKRLHSKLVPIRKQETKGFTISSKYGAGLANGGEFFDSILDDNCLIFFCTASNSYVQNSVILTGFEDFKARGKYSKDQLELFLTNLSSECAKLNTTTSDDRLPLEVLLMKIDLSSMSANIWQFGKFSWLSSDGEVSEGNQFPLAPAFFDKSFRNYKFCRGEKILILSPGFAYNSKGFLKKQPILRFAKEQLASEGREVLDELFFQLKKDKDQEFLDFDASAFHFEVNKNAIFQI